MSKLTVVIPRYKETEREMFPLLSSLNLQLGVDMSGVEVLVVTDGGGREPLSEDWLAGFDRLKVRQLALDANVGPGMVRQAGIDASDGDYLMFCDADDQLQNCGIVGAMVKKADDDQADMVYTPWLEELPAEGGGMTYLQHGPEMTWMHGKIFRRSFLEHEGIRHHPDLRVHEDSYFLALVSAFSERQTYLDAVSYVWRYHPDTITRCNGAAYTYTSIPTFIHACLEADKVIEERKADQMEYKIVQLLLYCYFSFHRPEWLSAEHRGHLIDAERALAKEIRPWMFYWYGAAPETKAAVYNEERKKSFSGCVESETLGEWLKRLRLNWDIYRNGSEGDGRLRNACRA